MKEAISGDFETQPSRIIAQYPVVPEPLSFLGHWRAEGV